MTTVREPAVAGTFYPNDAATLSTLISTYLDGEAWLNCPKAIIAPHAGYIYSGAIAGEVYRKLGSAHDKIKRVVMCSGKVYYDLLEERDARGIDDIYLLRVEQFYPFPAQSAVQELERFKNAEVVWCQEEPKNQGAWTFIEPNIEWVLGKIDAKHPRPKFVGRTASASPATGLASTHKKQQAALVNDALTIEGKE